MRVAAFVILCCALQYITSEIIEDKFHNIFNDENKYETKNETTSDKFEIEPITGNVVEKQITYKEFLSKNGCSSDVDEGDVKIMEFMITKDDQGRERIYEEDTIIKKVLGTSVHGNVGIPVTSTSSSSASAVNQTPQSNYSVATGSAASAAGGTGLTSSASSAAGTQSPESGSTSAAASSGSSYSAGGTRSTPVTQGSFRPFGIQGPKVVHLYNAQEPVSGLSGSPGASPTEKEDETGTKQPVNGLVSKAADTAPGQMPTGFDLYGSGLNGEFYSVISKAAASAATGRAGSASSSSSAAGNKGPESGSTSEERGPYENALERGGVNGPESRSSGSPGDTANKKGEKRGIQQLKSEPLSKPTDTAPGPMPTGLDFNGSGFNGEYNSVTSSAGTSAANGGAGSASSASSAAGNKGPESGSTSAAASSGSRNSAGGPGSTPVTQGSFRPFGIQGPKVVHLYNAQEPVSGLSGSPGASPTEKGDEPGTKQPVSGLVPKAADTAPGQIPTGFDLYGSGLNGEFYSVISSAAASAATGRAGSASSSSSAAGNKGPESGSTSEERGPYENALERGGVNGPESRSSGSPGDTANKKGDKSGIQQPKSEPLSKPTDTAPGPMPTGLDFYGSGFNGEYNSVTSSAGTSAANGGTESASSASSAAGNKGPESGSTSAAASSGSRYGASGPRNTPVTQRSFRPFGIQGPKVVHLYNAQEPVSGLSGSPGASPTEKEDETGTKQPVNGLVSKAADTAPGQMPTGFDLYGSGLNGEFYSVISSAAASAATGRAGSASSSSSAAGNKGPESGSTSEERGPYENALERGGVNGPGSRSSGSPGDTANKKGDKRGIQQPKSEPLSKPTDTAPGPMPTGLDFYGSGFNGEYNSVTSSAGTSAANGGTESASSASSAAGNKGPESGSTSAAASSGSRYSTGGPRSTPVTQGSFRPFGIQGPKVVHLYNAQEPVSGLSGSPGASPTEKGDETGTKQPVSGLVSKAADTAPGQMPTGIDLYGSGLNGEFYSVISSAAASAATGRAGSASSSSSAAGNNGPGSGSTIEKRGPYENALERGGVNGPGSRSSGSPGDTANKKGDKRGIQQPKSEPLLKPTDTAPGPMPTGLDFNGSGFNGEYNSVTSSAGTSAANGGAGSASSASSAAGNKGPESGSTSAAASSGSRNSAGGPGSTPVTQGSFRPFGIQGPKVVHLYNAQEPVSRLSGSPGASPTEKGDEAGTKQPVSGLVSKAADTAPGQMPTGFDLYGPGLNEEFYSVISSAAASAATGRAGSASSSSSAAGNKGPESGSTSAAASSGSRYSAGSPRSTPVTQGSFRPFGIQGPKVVHLYNAQEPVSGLSGSPGASPTEKGDETGTKQPVSGLVSKAADTAPGQMPAGIDLYGSGLNGEFYSVISSAAASAATGRAGSASSSSSAAGNKGPESGSTIEERGPYENALERGGVNGPGSRSSGSPGDTANKKGDKRGIQQPKSEPLSKPTDTAPGSMPTGLDFYGSGFNGEYNSVTSSAGTSAANGGAGSASSASSAAGNKGPESGSTSAAASSGSRYNAGGPGSTPVTQGSFRPFGIQGPKVVHLYNAQEPVSGLSGSPGASPIEKGDKTGTKQPVSGLVSKAANTAPGQMPTEFDLYGPGLNEEFYSVTSSAGTSAANGGTESASSASSAAGNKGPESGSTSAAASSGSRYSTGGPRSTPVTQGSFRPFGIQGPKVVHLYNAQEPVSGLSGSPGASPTEKGDETGTKQPVSGLVSKAADTAPGQMPTGIDLYGSGLNGEFYSVISSAAASAATGRAGSASSSSSAAGNNGPGSGSTIEERGPYENALERGGVNGPGSRSSGSPGDTANKKGDKRGIQQPKSEPLLKPTDTAPGPMPTGLDFNGSGFNGEYNSVTSSAGTSAANGGAGSASSASSAAGNKGPESGSTSAAASSGSRNSAGGPGSTPVTQGSFRPFGIQGPKVVHLYNAQEPVSRLSGSPGASPTEKGDAAGTKQPVSGLVSKAADTAPGQMPTGFDLYGPGLNEEFYSVTSSAGTSAANGGTESASLASSTAGNKGPESGSTSAAASSGSRYSAGGPRNTPVTQGSFRPFGIQGTKVVHFYNAQEPVSRLSGSPGASPTEKGDEIGTKQPVSGLVSKAADTAPGPMPTGFDLYGSGLNEEFYSVISSAAASAATGRAGSASLSSSAAGNEGPESGSTSEERGPYENALERGGVNGPGSRSSDSPGDTANKKGDKRGIQQPKSEPLSKLTDTAPGPMPTGLDLYGSGFNGEYNSVTSSAGTSTANGGKESASLASSTAGNKGPESGSTSAAASSGSRYSAGGPRNTPVTQGSFRPFGIQGPKVVHFYNAQEPVSRLSGSPGASPTEKGDEIGTKQPVSGLVSKAGDTAPAQMPTGFDLYGSGLNEEFYSVISSAAASAATGRAGSASSSSSAAGNKGPESRSTSAAASSGSRYSAGGPRSTPVTQGSFRPFGIQGPKVVHLYNAQEPVSGLSGSPGASPIEKGDKTGTKQPVSGLVSKAANTAPGQMPTEFDLYGSGLNGEFYSVISSAAASAATGRAGSASSSSSAAGNKGPESGSTSEERGPYENALERGGVNGPGSRSSGSPGDTANKKGDKRGIQQPKSGPLSKPTDTAPGQMPTVLDFYGSGFNGEYNSVTSSAGTSAANGGAGSASSASSAAGNKGPESGSTSAAASSGSRNNAGGPGSTPVTQGSFRPFGIQGPKVVHLYNAQEPVSGLSGSPGASPTEKGDETGTKQPVSGLVSKAADTAPGQMPTGFDLFGSGLNGEFYSVISSAAASAATGRAGSASSSSSAAGNKGPESGSTIEGRGPYENALERGVVNRPGSRSSGSPGDTANKKGDKRGIQQPKSEPLLKPTDTAPGPMPTRLDFYGSGFNGEYNSVTSSAGTSATDGGAGSASSTSSAAGNKGPESGSTSAAASSGSRYNAGGPGSTPVTQGSFRPFGIQGPKVVQSHNTKRPVSASSGTLGALPTTKEGVSVTQLPGSEPASRPIDRITGNNQNELGPDYYEPGYYGQDYLAPQELLIIVDNVGGSATDINRPESGSSGTPGSSPTTKEDVSATQQPGVGPASKQVDSDTVTGNSQNELGPDSNGPGYYGQDYLSPQELLTIEDNVGGSASDANIPESGSSGTPGASPTTKEGVSVTQRPGSEPASRPIDRITGNNQNELGPDYYEPGYYGQDYLAPQELLIIVDNVGGSATDINRPESGSSGTPGSSPTTKEDVSATQQPGVGPASKQVDSDTVIGNSQNELGPDSNGPGYYGQEYLSPQELLTIEDNVGGSASDANIPESGSSGTPGASPTTKEGVSVTQRPGSEPASRRIDRITGNNQNELGPDYYEPGYYGQDYLAPQELLIIVDNVGGSASDMNRPESGSSGTPGSSPTTKEDVSATQQPGVGPASKQVDSDTVTGNSQNELGPDSNGPGYYGQDYLSPQELLTIEDNVGGSASDANIPESGSSGTPGASPTTKEGVSVTQRPGSEPASRPIDRITGNNQSELVPDLYGPVYYRQDYSAPEELPTINDNKRGSESSSSLVARASAGESATGIPDPAPTTSGVASGVTSVQGRKRVRQACRLRSSQFVLRLGRKGQPCTFCY